MFFPDYNEDDEPIDIRSKFAFDIFDDCIIGHAIDGQNVYSYKKIVNKVMQFDLDQFEAEEFVKSHIINVYTYIFMMDLHE